MYEALIPQDINDPIDESDQEVDAFLPMEDPYDEMAQQPLLLRTANGALDFIENVEDKVEEFLHLDKPLPDPKPTTEAINTRELGSDSLRTRTESIGVGPQSTKLVVKSDFRRRLVLVNLGPNVVYVSNQPFNWAPGTLDPGPQTIGLPISKLDGTGPYTPLALCTKDEIWASVAFGGALSSVQVIEEFDLSR